MTPAAAGRLRVVSMLVAALLVQATVAADLRVGGVAPDLLVVVTVAAGLRGGARQGTVVGFAAGLLADLYAAGTPVGLWALTLCLAGFAVGALRDDVVPVSRLLTPVLAFVATAAASVVFVVLGDLVGQGQLVLVGRAALVRAALGEAAWSALLVLPAGWLYARAARGTAGVEALSRRAETLVR